MIGLDDIDGIAAEYVLGTLSRDERADVAILRTTRRELDSALIAWEKRLSPLNETTAEAMPSPHLFTKIEKRIDETPRSSGRTRPFAYQPRIWRRLAFAASLAFFMVTSFLVHNAIQRQTTPHLIALLQPVGATPAFLAVLDQKTATLNIHVLATSLPPDKSYELWLVVEGEPTPHSLGVLPQQDSKTVSLTGIDADTIRHATLAISIEPLGGSPTGAPTGPVVFAGKFVPS